MPICGRHALLARLNRLLILGWSETPREPDLTSDEAVIAYAERFRRLTNSSAAGVE